MRWDEGKGWLCCIIMQHVLENNLERNREKKQQQQTKASNNNKRSWESLGKKRGKKNEKYKSEYKLLDQEYYLLGLSRFQVEEKAFLF